MKRSVFPTDQPLPDDEPEMVEAITALKAAGIRFKRPTMYQLKVAVWSFYPSKGTILRDRSDSPEGERGIEALLSKLEIGQGAKKRSPLRKEVSHLFEIK